MEQDLMDFFDMTKKFTRNEASRGCVSGNPMASDPGEASKVESVKKENLGTEYVKEIVDREKQKLELFGIGGSAPKRNRTLDDIDSDDEEGSEAPDLREDNEYYSKHHFDLNRDKSLPIYAQREEIMKAINENTVVILKGETGCGKTTQVPQYILDEAYQKRKYCNIVVTQPRRIAAISIANRVSHERHWEPGTVCSYQVSLHRQSKSEEDGRLLYCTTGILLNLLIKHKTLTHYTHIVLDEVHERDQEMDFLLIVVRRLLATNSKHVKVILMSATIDSREFVNYFTTKGAIPPVINASSERKYPLVKFYRDHLRNIQWHDDHANTNEPGIGSQGYAAAIKILLVIDNVERMAEGQTEQSYEENLKTASVLIFLPGINEIDTMAENINHLVQENPNVKVTIVRCHSLMTPDAQRDVFAAPPLGYRKIILTTNIAESSITVPDVSYVIDFCLAKVLVTDTATNFSSLRLVWASKSNCRQRAGRVGRLRSGRVYRMVNKSFYIKHMHEFGIPEMLRSPLESSVLKAKELDMGSPLEILALALSPPKLSDIKNTVLLLKEVGALYPTVDGNYADFDGDLTPWGSIMTRLPLDVRLSRLVLLGYVFNCLEEAIVIAAGLSVRGLFTQERHRSHEAYWMHYVFADGSSSDLVAIWRFYKTYLNMCADRMMQDSAAQWARRYHISLRSLKEMHLLVQELRNRCNRLHIHPMQSGSCQIKDDRERAIILKILIAGAFYPNYFIRSNKSNPNYDRSTYQVISGHDPCHTVYFTHFEPRYMGELYTRRIKDLFLEAKIPPENMDVTFQPGSEKVFVTFKQTDDDMDQANLIQVPGRILTDVYKAVRLRTEKQFHPIRVMDHALAIRYVQEHKIGKVIEGQWHPPSKPFNAGLVALPSVYDKNVIGYITHVVSCGKFFFQPITLADTVVNMAERINTPQNLSHYVLDAGSITKNMKLLAKRGDDFQRAQVIRVERHSYQYPKFRVRFIDFGDTALLPKEQLRFMSERLKREYDELPARAFECRLALVQPAAMTSNYNRWPVKANEMVRKMAKSGRVELEIYSLVNNVAAVFIKMREGVLNDKLVEHNYARRSDEDFMSLQDHDFRLRKQQRSPYLSEAERKQINEEYLRTIQLPQDADLPPPPLQKCQTVVRLRGPYSPLEASMYSTIQASAWKTVKIDPVSVNSVLLNSNPQDRHDQLIVAASVAAISNNQVLIARGSTVMPNTHGFGALMALLFCPSVQIKCNKQRTKFVSLLAGLGFNPETMESYFEDHDVVMNLDVNILEDDVRLINQMRYNIDTVFFKYEGEDVPAVSAVDRIFVFNQLRSLLSRLLNKDRSYIEPHSSSLDNVWEKLDNLEPQSEPYGKRAIFPMHTIPELQSEHVTVTLALQENCKELYSWRTFDGFMQPLNCKLCNQLVESVSELRIHLLSQLHRDREKQIGFHLN